MYNDTVLKHFMEPQNAGDMENPDAVGDYGSPVCGDMMQIFLKIDENQVITDVKFKTFGCGSAIAASSVATELIKGKTLEEALAITNKDVVEELGGLPGPKVHCSVLSEQAIRVAIYNYAKEHNLEFEALKGFNPDAEFDHDHDDHEDDH